MWGKCLEEERRVLQSVKGDGLTIVVIVANDNLFNLPKLAHFAPEILIEGVKVIL